MDVDGLVRALHDTGLFRMLQPQRAGGAELDYDCLVDMGAIIARGCASTAWTMTNLASHHWMVAMYPPETQDQVWGENPDAMIASAFIFPAGRAKRTDGGYRLSGRWAFSSGVDISEWNLIGGIVAADDGGAEHATAGSDNHGATDAAPAGDEGAGLCARSARC